MNPTHRTRRESPREHGIIDAHLERVRSFYEQPRPDGVTRAARGYRRMLAHYYALMFPPDASVLEVGCGGGDLLALLPNRDMTGVDLSAGADRSRRAAGCRTANFMCRRANGWRWPAPST